MDWFHFGNQSTNPPTLPHSPLPSPRGQRPSAAGHARFTSGHATSARSYSFWSNCCSVATSSLFSSQSLQSWTAFAILSLSSSPNKALSGSSSSAFIIVAQYLRSDAADAAMATGLESQGGNALRAGKRKCGRYVHKTSQTRDETNDKKEMNSQYVAWQTDVNVAYSIIFETTKPFIQKTHKQASKQTTKAMKQTNNQSNEPNTKHSKQNKTTKHKENKTNKQTHKQTNKQTNKQTTKEPHTYSYHSPKQTNKQTNKQRNTSLPTYIPTYLPL